MNPNTTSQPATPWYRHPWPWILMSGPAAAVIAGFVTLYIAIVHVDPLVVDQYYKEGLAINRVLARDKEAARRNYRATIMLNQERTLVRVRIAGEMLPAELRLNFIHPTKAGLDREFPARQIQPGLYEGAVRLAPALRWNVELEDADKLWRLTGVWLASEDSFALKARN